MKFMKRKEKTIHYLYKTTCIITNRYYIGMHSTHNLDDNYMGSGKRLRRSIRKYGVNNHKKEILEFFENRDLLIEAEKKIITYEILKDTNCMNLMCGGKGGYVSEEHYKKTSKICGNIHSERMKNDLEYRNKTIKILYKNLEKAREEGKYNGMQNFKGKKHSNETKKIISEIKKGTGIGEMNSQYGTCWITKNNINKKIKKEELDLYLIDGWIKGRKIN